MLNKLIKLIQDFLMSFQKKSIENINKDFPKYVQQKKTEEVKSRIKEWADAIEDMEDDEKNPNDVVSRYNNPGAIRKWNGSFLKFDSMEQGRMYLEDYLIRACMGRHAAYPDGGETTLLDFTRKYAPRSDNNNPEKYAKFVADKLGVSVNIKIKNLL